MRDLVFTFSPYPNRLISERFFIFVCVCMCTLALWRYEVYACRETKCGTIMRVRKGRTLRREHT
jgi:hypothetical protein